MRRLVLRTAVSAILLSCFAAPGPGAPADERFLLPLDLRFDRPVFQRYDDSNRLIPVLDGFGFNTRPGEPMLPLKVLMAAIPEGCVPELHVLHLESETLGPVPITPVPALEVFDRRDHGRDAGDEGTEARRTRQSFREAPGPWGRDAEFPDAPIRLGQIGWLRDQRVVEIVLMPVIVHPRRGLGRSIRTMQAEVVCAGVSGVAPETTAAAADPFFEDLYRSRLVNYDQGRGFRRARTTAAFSEIQASAAFVASFAPGTPRWKLLVSTEGIHHLTYTDLATLAPGILDVDPRSWLLEAEGVAVPFAVRNAAGGDGGADGFDPGDYLEFYGSPKGGPPTVPNHDFAGTFPDVYQANDFTDTQVYWLGVSEGSDALPRIPDRDGFPGQGFPLAPHFEAEARWEENNLYLPLGEAEPFFSMPSLLAGSTQAARDLALPVPGIVPVSVVAGVTLRIRGGSSQTSDPDHRIRVWINENTADIADMTYDGEVLFTHEFTVPQSMLRDPSTIHVTAPGLSGVTVDRQYLDSISVRYRRGFAALGDLLVFDYPNQSARFQVTGLTAGPPVVFEITRRLAGSLEIDPVRITGAAVAGGATVSCTFEVAEDPSAPAVRRFVVVGPGGIRRPDAVLPAGPVVLQDPARAADILVIAARDAVDPSRDTVDASPGGALDLLLAHRLNARGLTSAIVFVDQIYDEFSFGLRDPGAIRRFLAYTHANWRGPGGTAPAPSFVLLAGDASPDYKDTLGLPDWVDQVPTPILFNQNSLLGYYSSDHWYASFLGDDFLPDVHLGRISSRTAAGSAAVFEKIRRYEQSPAPGPWKGRGVLIASDGKFAGEAAEFEAIQAAIARAHFDTPPYSTPVPPLYYEEPPWNATDAAGFSQAIDDTIAAGAAALSFIGHGTFTGWGLDRFYDTARAAALSNGDLLPMVLNVNCLSGGFHYLGPEGALGEALLNNPAGGAIAVVAPSGLSSVFVGETISDGFFEPLFGRSRRGPIGAVMSGIWSALAEYGAVLDLQSYTLLGDPATVFASPAPPPPALLTATAGNNRVELDWVAPATPVSGYRIYRSAAGPVGPYSVVTCDPVDATACSDRTVSNGTVYYYYAVSADPEGFEGAASNLNDDCDAGPLCVRAQPLNPDPPSPPSGLVVIDPGNGSLLQVSWNANPEADIRRYTLYYGTAPSVYGTRIDLGAASTSTTLGGLTNGVRYYMALTATNTSGHESAPSAEIAGTPHLIQGIAPPRAIADLVVARFGNDLVLTWSRPLTDIYGRATVVAGYRIYRGSTPGFQPFAAAPYAFIGSPTQTTFTDSGTGNQPGNLYYLVAAVDVNGLMSGVGRELPGGIEDLAVSTVGAADLRLVWSAVTLDMLGFPTNVDHYQVHMTTVPAGRGSLSATTLVTGMDNVRTLSVDLPKPAGPAYFSVLAVDGRGNLSPF